METLEAISKRASLKTCCSAQDVEKEKIEKILKAARLAPSARNTQPWRFIVIKGRENVKNVVTKAFGEGNQVVMEAPALIIVCANPSDDVIAEEKEYYLFDLGLAVVRFVIATPLAYPAQGSYDKAAKERLSQRDRKELKELVYMNAWGKPF